MKYVELEQRSDVWFKWREKGITATEAVAISGHSEFATPWRVWAEKTGRVLPPDLSGNPYVQYGIEHEDEVRNLFMVKHEDVVMPACGEWDQNPVFRASFDGLNSQGEPVEIKCPGESTLEDVLARGLSSDAYQMYQWQVQWQMMVADAPRGWLVFYLGDDKILDFEVARDNDKIAELRNKCSEFWKKNILVDKAPDKIPERDLYVPKGDDLITWGRAAADYRRIKEEIDRLSLLLEEPKQTLIRLMGDYRNADFYGVSVCQYTQRGSIDYKSVLTQRGQPLTEDELNNYRRESRNIQKVTLSQSEYPRDFVPERNADIAEAIHTIRTDRNNLCW